MNVTNVLMLMTENDYIILYFYVDDILIIGSNN